MTFTSHTQMDSKFYNTAGKPAGLLGRIKQLFARLFLKSHEERQQELSEEERRRQEIIELRQRLHEGIHRRLKK